MCVSVCESVCVCVWMCQDLSSIVFLSLCPVLSRLIFPISVYVSVADVPNFNGTFNRHYLLISFISFVFYSLSPFTQFSSITNSYHPHTLPSFFSNALSESFSFFSSSFTFPIFHLPILSFSMSFPIPFLSNLPILSILFTTIAYTYSWRLKT